MCGLAGAVWLEAPDDAELRLRRAQSALRHRGPDDSGLRIWRNGGTFLGLAHTRLSIIDLSQAGRQPLVSADGKLAIIYNGEVYNYRELREELRNSGHVFNTETDTEVVLAAWREWGENCLQRFEGMFAFVIYDKSKQILFIARDAFGIKPLFYFQSKGVIGFASELPALLEIKPGRRLAELGQAYDYLVYGAYDHGEQTFVKGVRRLPPGHVLRCRIGSALALEVAQWFNVAERSEASLSWDDAVDAVREAFLRNVSLHLRSDVPVGVALSGGLDSTAIACALRHIHHDREITAFSFVSADDRLSEESWARDAAEWVGAKQVLVRRSAKSLLRDLRQLIQAQGEPFGSTSIYAQYAVFAAAREAGIKVLLEGQGGDETFAGYDSYLGSRVLELLRSGSWKRAVRLVRSWARRRSMGVRYPLALTLDQVLPERIRRTGRMFIGRPRPLHWWKRDWIEERGLKDRQEPRFKPEGLASGEILREHLRYSFRCRPLPGLLRHGDRNAMHFSIENRVPFLTPALVNLALSLPSHYLLSNDGTAKFILREALRDILPPEIYDRHDKIGFRTEENRWIGGELGKVLGVAINSDIPFLDIKGIRDHIDAVASGKLPYTWTVWRLLNFCIWWDVMEIEGVGSNRS